MSRLLLISTALAILPASAALAAQDCGYDIYIVVDADESIADCSKSLAQAQNDEIRSRMLVHRGDAYQKKQDAEHALADYDQALRLDPSSSDAYFRRSSFYRYARKDLDQALADITQAIKVKPQSYPYYGARASLYVEMGKLELATADYDRELALNPKGYTDLVDRGNLWRQRGDYQKALADYTEALKLSPTYSNAINASDAANAMLALGPTLEPAIRSGPEPRFTRASATKTGVYTAEVWTLDGKPHHCAITASYGEPASAFGRSATFYALTLANSKWGFPPQTSYPVTVSAGKASEVSTASAINGSTVGIVLKADPAFLAAWHGTYRVQVKAATTTIDVDGSSNSVLAALDECWSRASQAEAANPFGAALRATAPASNPFAASPSDTPPTAAMPPLLRRLLGAPQ